MKSAPNSQHKGYWGYTAKALITLIYLAFTITFIASAWSTHNFLFILGAVGGAFIILLQVESFHDWFTNTFIPSLNKIEQDIIETIKPLAKKVRLPRTIITIIVLALIILGFVIKDYTSIPSMFQNHTSPNNGIYVTSIQVDEGKNNKHIMGNMSIGIIDHTSPFNQYDANNNSAERGLEDRIFTENQACRHKPYVTLIVATVLSQTVADTGLSSNVGLDNLRGAYMAQHNFNQDQSQHYCLHLLIGNFGTKGVVSQTVPTLMQQIKLYADSDSQHFMGIVGFPFSVSVRQALSWRSSDIPIITPSASADSFADPNSSSPLPANFYTNFYRVVPPVKVESQVLADFMANHTGNYLAPAQTQTVLFTDLHDTYSRFLGNDMYANLHGNVKEIDYTVGQPDTLDPGIDYIKQNQCNSNPQHQCNHIQIFFSGYADDLNTLKYKIKAAQDNGDLPQFTIPIIGGEGLYDLGSYNIGNYANLFFSLNASNAWINPGSLSDGIPIPSQFQSCPNKNLYNQPFNCEFREFFHQVYPISIYGSELAGTHVLLMYDAVQSFINALSHADKETNIPPRQAVNKHWSDVAFQGITGQIQFPQSNNNSVNDPINKPIYVACTDSHSQIHILGRYDTNGILPPQFNPSPGSDQDQLNKCING